MSSLIDADSWLNTRFPVGEDLKSPDLSQTTREKDAPIKQYWLNPHQALSKVRQVAQVVNGWRGCFDAKCLRDRALEEPTQHIDLSIQEELMGKMLYRKSLIKN